jgi:hypothetical protein
LVLAVASAGLLLGHTIAYVIALPLPDERAGVLDVSGHGYWSWAVPLATGLFSWAVVRHVRRHFQAGRSDARPPSASGLGRRLAVAQVCLFLLLELTERVASGETLATLGEHHLLLIGLITQVVVAAALARLCGWLARAACRLGRWLAGGDKPVPAAAVPWSALTALATSAAATSPRTSRGPPWSPSYNL